MGLVNKKEADEATDIARRTPGVRKVVRVFEYAS
jgi:osmotically-inducible protein OsmY